MTWRRSIIVVLIFLVAVSALALFIGKIGRRAGEAKVTQQVERQHADRVAEARADERAAAVVSSSISRRVARADDLSTQAVKATIKDLRDAIDTVPPAVAGAPAPAAPVDRLRDTLNADIDRANRAASAAGPAG